jgi:DNA-binding transcriptional LysR family regulator
VPEIATVWLASEMAVFARVYELGSFTAAARAIGVPKVAVSRAVASLERRLQVPLLTRTTRRMALTDAGRVLLPYCRQALEAEEQATAIAAGADAGGPLRVLTDSGYGRLLVAPLVPRFLEHYPDSPLQVELVDQLPELPAAGWDLLVTSRPPASTALAGTELGAPPLLLCAAPAYLKRTAAPHRPQQLAQHALLVAGSGPRTEIRLRRGQEELALVLAPKLAVDDPAVVHASTAAGLGVGLLPEFLCRQGLSMGRLEQVLPGWEVADSLRLYALYDPRRVASPRIRRFIDFVLANMIPVLGGH